ncbi:hypothetical protein [Aeromicrobium sp. UC242_57]|uniref:hypothetical protein n=1 Tax=Aeromicrobium sp. UC242_57 TaxID=3374624 RepID=UPI0037ACFD8F
MVWTPGLRSAAGALTVTLAMASLTAPAQAAESVATARAGTLIGWGTASTAAATTLPESLQDTPFTDIATGGGFTVALTAAGKIVVLGASTAPGLEARSHPTGASRRRGPLK